MSIASIAANIKQRQKIAHSSSYMGRLADAKKDTIPAEINTNKQTCFCGFSAYYKFRRCPNCNTEVI